MYIFGGVDTKQLRYNDLYSYDVERRNWTLEEPEGTIPRARTFHKCVSFNNIMYLLGGFDGQRLNDMYYIALSGSLIEEDGQSLRISSRPASQGTSREDTVMWEEDELEEMSMAKLKKRNYLLKK